MGMTVKFFKDGSCLEYDRGRFDDWCVYLTRPGREREAFTDKQIFAGLSSLGRKYGGRRVYDDFVKIYERTGPAVSGEALKGIAELSLAYGPDAVCMDILFSCLYLAMTAEENKEYTRLGKRIKRLGVHRLLLEQADCREAADFMRGMNWREIDSLCKNRGF